MKRYKTFLLPAIAVMLISACAPLQETINPYEENFKCKAKNNAGECIDTQAAYKKARYPKPAQNIKSDFDHEVKQDVQVSRYKILAELLRKEKKPLLQPPKILRVLLLPYKGEKEELFMSRYVYVKIEDSQWILTDLVEK